MVQGGTVIGRFYLDMHPREGKFAHSALAATRAMGVGSKARISPLDKRARLLIPAAKMIQQTNSGWLRIMPLAALFGDEDYRPALGGDRAFQRVQRRVATGFFMQSAMVLFRNPDIMLFLARDGGVFVLIELARDMMERGTPAVDLSLAKLGRPFGVSRTHVRQLLMTAEPQKLVEIDQAERRIALKPRLLQSLDRFIVDGMSNHDLTGAAARRELGRD